MNPGDFTNYRVVSEMAISRGRLGDMFTEQRRCKEPNIPAGAFPGPVAKGVPALRKPKCAGQVQKIAANLRSYHKGQTLDDLARRAGTPTPSS